MKNKLFKLFMVSRPISWPNTSYPFAVGYLISGGSVDLLWLIATLYFLWPYNLFLYGINDVFDYESDILNPRKGGIEGMKEERTLHPTIIKASIILNLPFLVYLYANGSAQSNLVLSMVLFFVFAYSAAKLRFKEIPLLDSITSSSHFVGPLVYALSLNGFNSKAWPFVLAFFFWGMASHAFGAVQDIIPDRKAKLSSIATYLGAKNTVRLTFGLYTTASFLILVPGGYITLIGLAGLAYIWNIYPYLSVSDKNSYITNRAWKRFIWLNYATGFVVTMVLIKLFILD